MNIFFENVKTIEVVIRKEYAVKFANETGTKFKFENATEIEISKDRVYIYQLNKNTKFTPFFFKRHIAYIKYNEQILTF